MKQSLDLKIGQHLTITPQLQQAIRLLQLSSIELEQEVREVLEKNPLLEEAVEGADDRTENSDEPGEQPPENTAETSPDDADGEVDADWADGYEISGATSSKSGDDDDDHYDLEGRNSQPTSLREHLFWQLQMTAMSERDKAIATALIDAIDDDGYLTATTDDILAALVEPEVTPDEIEAVLHQIQNFDPLGVGARHLGECLDLQLRRLEGDTSVRDAARLLTTPDYLKLLGQRDFKELKRLTHLDNDALSQALALLKTLNPRPGSRITSAPDLYVIPDIIVKKRRGIWRAELNMDAVPKLRINRHYENLMQHGRSSAQDRFLREHLQEARWFLKSLHSRNETLLRVARVIVDRQRAFLDHGPEAMKPLVLHDIASEISMHESTISRVTTNKHMMTPKGIFELKYFFSSHVGTVDGGTCSATAIRSLIRKIIEKEPPNKPISDNKIAELLEEQGINVARRTVAKYREALNIPPSSQRKSIT
ncbi:MAG: RNA polymerase factor sigma-54 [Gammaproteobacteria bacterium]|nr:RNA polymerase factor sigma-54 [Gammaproteobacteria bacterium]